MMVDFGKYRMSTDRTLVTYKCESCGEIDEYVTEMPAGWKHAVKHNMNYCGGLLVEVSRRTEPRSVSR